MTLRPSSTCAISRPRNNTEHLHFVFMFQETLSLLHLEVDVVRARFGTQADFLGLGVMSVVMSLLFLVVLVLAEIHDSADGRTLVRSDFDQVQIGFSSLIECVLRGDDTQLFTIGRDHAHRSNSNLVVNSCLKLFGDLIYPFLRELRTTKSDC